MPCIKIRQYDAEFERLEKSVLKCAFVVGHPERPTEFYRISRVVPAITSNKIVIYIDKYYDFHFERSDILQMLSHNNISRSLGINSKCGLVLITPLIKELYL